MEIQYYDITDSTNVRAKEYIKTHDFERMLFVANEQTAGRGRLGKSFFSPKDTGIYMTFAFKNNLPLCDTVHITTAAAVAVAKAIEKHTAHSTRIKWVNDIYINEKKVCGILCESTGGYVIIGVGVNVTTAEFPDEIKDVATSLYTDCKDLLIENICDNLSALCDDILNYDYIEFYRERLMWKGEEITYDGNTVTLVDVDDRGALVVLQNNQTKTISTGEISIRHLPQRKNPRLKGYDYSTEGAYFVTVCVKDRKNLLGEVVGCGDFDTPQVKLSEYGQILEKYVEIMTKKYTHIKVDKYVIMPDHFHMIISIASKKDGASETAAPYNNELSKFVSLLKRYCNREYGQNIWQASFNDRIIRNEKEYLKILNYVDTNAFQDR